MLCGFILFLVVWIGVSTQIMVSVLLVELPVFVFFEHEHAGGRIKHH